MPAAPPARSSAAPPQPPGGGAIRVDLPHFAFATAIAGWVGWFCWDAWRSAPDLENLILILPVSAAAMVLYVVIAAGCVNRLGQVPRRRPIPGPVALKIAGTMVLLVVFVVAGPTVGFDAASFAYLLAMLLFLGERRVVVLLLAPLVFCAVVIYSFNIVLATPLPLLLLRGEGP